MSSSRQNGLQSVEDHSNEAPADPETRRIVEGMAKLVAVHGLWIEKNFMDDNVNNDIFSFVKSSEHPYHAFYQHKIAEYQNAQNQPDVPATDPPSRDPARSLLLFTCPDEGFTRKEFAIIKLTAQFVVRYGIYFWVDLITSVTVNPPQFDFEFMKTTDSRFSFFLGLVDAYERVLIPYRKLLVLNPCKEPVLEGFFKLLKGEKHDEEGVEMAMIDLHAFVGGLDYFASREGGELSPPGRLSTQMQSGIPDAPATDDGLYPLSCRDPPRAPRHYPFTYPQGITCKQLGIIKLAAQFVVRYGYVFWLGLIKIAIMNPQPEFDFLKSADLYDLFHRLVAAYSKVLMSSQELCKPGAPAPTETVLDGFFNLLRGGKQEGAEIAVSDLHAFVGALDYFANRDDEEFSPPQGDLSTTMYTPIYYPPAPPPPLGPQSSHPQAPRPYCQTPMPGMSPPPPLPLLEEPEPKRQNFDESALVPEDQFLAQHPGPSTIRIGVVVQDDDDDGQVIEVKVQSLSESVASLKEKIVEKPGF